MNYQICFSTHTYIHTDRETQRQTDRKTERQTDRQTGQTDRKADAHTDKKKNRPTDTQTENRRVRKTDRQIYRRHKQRERFINLLACRSLTLNFALSSCCIGRFGWSHTSKHSFRIHCYHKEVADGPYTFKNIHPN